MDSAGRMTLIRELCSFENRLTGTDSERRAAGWLAERLRSMGRKSDIEPTYVHPQYGLVHATHCLMGFAGSLLAIAVPAAGFALVLVAAASMYLDLNARIYVVRRLFFRRASQNVVSRGGRPNAPATLVLTAHYDAARTGAAFDPDRMRRGARLAERVPFPLGPFRVLFWSLAILLPILGARMAGVDSTALSFIQLPPTFILLVGVFMLVDIELSDPVPAANDNASGVAAVLSLAEAIADEPADHLDVWVVLTGGEECLQEGMRAFLGAHHPDLDPESTFFVNVDAVGNGDIRFEAAAGWVVSYDMGQRLLELCAAIAEADRDDGDGYRAKPLRHASAHDSMPPRLAGYPATTITCLDEHGVVPSYHTLDDTPDRIDSSAVDRAHSFVRELVRQLDRDVGRRSAATTTEP
jgi:hypothetical protein